MKKTILMAVIAMMGIQSQAQIVTSNTKMVTRQEMAQPVNGWSTFGIEYLPSKLAPDHGDSESFTGFAVNYTKASPLTQSIPLLLEWGFGAQLSHWGDSESDSDGSYKEEYKSSLNMISLKVPVNIIYDFQIPNSSINIDPYIGLHLRGNLWGEAKEEYEVSGRGYEDSDSESWNLFSDDDMGDSWKRFQLGWQIGVKARFGNNFYVGLGYGSDLSEIAKKAKIHETSISAGLVF